MTTVEEHIEGMRAAGHRMPRRFTRGGLLYTRQRDDSIGDHYLYEPVEAFEVDGIRYSYAHIGRSPGLMLESIRDNGMSGIRMNHSRPPTEDELDRWMRAEDTYSWIYDPRDNDTSDPWT